jgi:hypothetical protein
METCAIAAPEAANTAKANVVAHFHDAPNRIDERAVASPTIA